MDARELTKKQHETDAQLTDHKKRIEYMEQELAKLRLLMEDMQIDVKMLKNSRR